MKIKSAFEILDKDGDGFIEEEELGNMIGIDENYDHTILKRMISEVD